MLCLISTVPSATQLRRTLRFYSFILYVCAVSFRISAKTWPSMMKDLDVCPLVTSMTKWEPLVATEGLSQASTSFYRQPWRVPVARETRRWSGSADDDWCNDCRLRPRCSERDLWYHWRAFLLFRTLGWLDFVHATGRLDNRWTIK